MFTFSIGTHNTPEQRLANAASVFTETPVMEMSESVDFASAACRTMVKAMCGEGYMDMMVKCDGETVWLTQAQMCQLFGRERSVITKHIGNVFREGELPIEGNVQNLHIANSDKPVAFYDLDVVISVGYRVKSIAGTRFRQWATKVLRAILLEGVKRDYRLEALENRVALTESGLQRVEEGLNYLVEQMSAPTMKRVIGFSKEVS